MEFLIVIVSVLMLFLIVWTTSTLSSLKSSLPKSKDTPIYNKKSWFYFYTVFLSKFIKGSFVVYIDYECVPLNGFNLALEKEDSLYYFHVSEWSKMKRFSTSIDVDYFDPDKKWVKIYKVL